MFITLLATLASSTAAAATEHGSQFAPDFHRPSPPPPPVDPALEKLEEKYDAIKTATCAKVHSSKAVPTLDASDAAALLSAWTAFDGTSSEAPVVAAAKKLMTPALDTFLSLPDSFTGADGLDAAMVKCAVMAGAYNGVGGNPKAEAEVVAVGGASPAAPAHLLARFAVQGAAEEALVDKLLSDTVLMRDMLVAGGAETGHYGEAMQIYEQLQQASPLLRASLAATAAADAAWDDRSTATVLKRLALATSLFFAVPFPIWRAKNATTDIVNPVERYQHFEKYYQAGDLDPAFPVLSSFELSHTVDTNADSEDMVWLRQSLADYRPDTIAMSYHWRYAETVHTEVAYGDSQCPTFPAGVCTGSYADIPVGGDVCGGRAFWGRFTRKTFGVPTWGATEHAHAAMSSWTPTGWNVLLGAPWPDCWWGQRGGEDFVLEATARENRAAFQKVLRGGWVSQALGEVQPTQMWHAKSAFTHTGDAGVWAVLMMYMKKAQVASDPPMNRAIPAAVAPIVNKVDALLARSLKPLPPPPPPSAAADGTITIPAVSFSSKNRSAPVTIILGFTEGTQLVSNGCTSSVGPPCFNPESSAVTYDFTAATAGTYYLTAQFATYHFNQDLFVSVNGGKNVDVGMFWTKGVWNLTQPIKVALTAGKNSLVFTRLSGRDVSFKEFALATKEPVVPPHPGNFTPVPSPPSPPSSAYIEVAADTTCVKQGIADVTEAECGHACLALGFKSTGPRARANMSGCFVMATGQYAGNCNFNTNKSATCTPPCTLYGATTRSLCIRK